MHKLISRFPQQLEEALEIGVSAKLTPTQSPLSNILVTGLGGSGIGGTIVSELVSREATLPIIVNKDYFLPAFVGKTTLVIVSSYSGNTEETLAAMEAAIKKQAKIICITSGGKILEMAQKNGIDHIIIPGGMPPRSCLGYSLTQLFFILEFFGVTSGHFKKDLSAAIALLTKEQPGIKQEASSVAARLFGNIPIIYAAAGAEGVAIRFRQQINENAKMLCWHHVIPEMNHNELVGWKENYKNTTAVIFRNTLDYERTQTRIEINKKIIAPRCHEIIELWSKGNTPTEQAIYHIHLGDWISVYLADLKKIDATEVKVIDFLKEELSKK